MTVIMARIQALFYTAGISVQIACQIKSQSQLQISTLEHGFDDLMVYEKRCVCVYFEKKVFIS